MLQKRVSITPKALSSLFFEDRISNLGSTIIEKRKSRDELIQLFKLKTEKEEFLWDNDPQYSEPRCGHRSSLQQEIVKSCNQRYTFFTNRI